MKIKQPQILIAASVIGISIPAAYVLYLILQAGDLSNFDYWWMTWNFYSTDGFSTNPFNWIFRANEHFVLIPAIIYALNIVITQGSNIGLCLVTWFLAWLQCHVSIALLPSNLRRSPLLFILLVLCISIFNFTPAAAHNWMRGFSGVHWVIANLFVICAIFCLRSQAIILSYNNDLTPGNEFEINPQVRQGIENNPMVRQGLENNPIVRQRINSLSHSESPLKRTEEATFPQSNEESIGSVESHPKRNQETINHQIISPNITQQLISPRSGTSAMRQGFKPLPALPQQDGWVIGSILFGILGCMSYSTPLGLWPILCAASVVLRFPRRVTYLYFAVSIAIISLYFITYKTPSHHPSLTKINPLKTLEYIPTYLGGIFSENIIAASIIGTLGLIAMAGFIGYWLLGKKVDRPQWLPWLSIQAYTVQTALMAAVSRSGFGVEQATVSRYATLPALFWMSTIILAVLCARELQPIPKIHNRFLTPLLAIVTVGIILMYGVGSQTASAIARRATYQPLVALSLQLGITDVGLIKERVGNRPAAFVGLIDALKTHNLVPFNRDIKQHNFCAPLNTKIDSNLLAAPKEGVPGYFDTVTKLAPAAARVTGWIGDPDNNVKCIVILDRDNVVQGFAMSGFPRPDLAKIFGPAYEFAAWKGYIQTSQKETLLTAYASFKNREGWIALRHSQTTNKN
ncbi:MAG: hypothetical protein MUE44_13120 [Oscillatoriaceae cyanobacterium Prado104]|jgi:hypothetical protein|nr:hypothetical protein [Oscillatoriaceae cyanobacterium Prado104]